jgi:anaerobic magnesium-protoporphyrin IX monomethyl ester cyclase
MKVSFIHPNLHGELITNLGLAYLMTVTQSRHKVSLIDLAFHRDNWKNYIKWKIKKNRPDVIAVSCLTFNFNTALKIVSFIKEMDPSIPTIFGGIHPTLLPEEVLSHHLVDTICIGEGEETFPDYLEHLEKGSSLKNVKGIWFKENGKIFRNELRPLVSNLDNIPFPNWDLWEMEKYFTISPHAKLIEMLGSRGCPYSCTYCSNHALRNLLPGKYVRFRSPENIIEEIKINKEKYWHQGFRYIEFWDEIFGMNKKILERFCRLYIEEGFNHEIFWICNNRADLVTESWARFVKNAGCMLVQMGIEAGNEKIRNQIYQKNLSTDQIVKAANILHNYDIMMRFNLMLGGPGETISTMEESVQIVEKLKPESFFFSIFQPLPKTEILQKITELQGDINYNGWNSNPDFWQKSLLNLPHLKSKDIVKFKRKMTSKIVWKSLWQGLSLRKFKFIKDILKFLIIIKPKYHILLQFLMVFTIRQYQIGDWIRRNEEKLSKVSLCE